MKRNIEAAAGMFGGDDEKFGKFMRMVKGYLIAREKLINGLEEASKGFEKGADESWRTELLNCLGGFLIEIDVPGELVWPLMNIEFDERQRLFGRDDGPAGRFTGLDLGM